jgi:phytoene dehydrogenase-like protein
VVAHWALDGPVPWSSPLMERTGTFHVTGGVDTLTQGAAEISRGLVPERPFLIGGQYAGHDPSRAPQGREIVSAYTHVPQQVRGDAGDDDLTGSWDSAEVERLADRMQREIEQVAPGFGDRVLERTVTGPHELERADENLVGGALNGGTAQIHQQLVFRPVPGLGRAETPVPGLYLASASAHPGGGVHGACGMNAARAALAERTPRLQRVAARVAGVAVGRALPEPGDAGGAAAGDRRPAQERAAARG